jgi:hypothetical protein
MLIKGVRKFAIRTLVAGGKARTEFARPAAVAVHTINTRAPIGRAVLTERACLAVEL